MSRQNSGKESGPGPICGVEFYQMTVFNKNKPVTTLQRGSLSETKVAVSVPERCL